MTEASDSAVRFGEGHHLDLPGRGTTYYEIIKGKPGSPTYVLVHGWTANAGLNFGTAKPAFEGMNALAFDMRGHGRGIHDKHVKYSRDFPYIEANADDLAVALDELGIDKAIFVGYSMGTAIVSQVLNRHPDKVAGLVLCAGAPRFEGLAPFHKTLVIASKALGVVPWEARRAISEGTQLVLRNLPLPSQVAENDYVALLQSMAMNDLLVTLQAGIGLHHHDATEWLQNAKVPVAVLIPAHDKLLPAKHQWVFLDVVPGAEPYVLGKGHLGARSKEFAPLLREAVLDVTARAEKQGLILPPGVSGLS